MGLFARGMYSKKVYNRSYSALHQVRWLAARSVGFDGDYAAWMALNSEDEASGEGSWRHYASQFPALIHHSDCEGGYVPSYWLEGVDISGSFNIHSIDALWEEMQRLESWLARTTEEISPYAREIFQLFYALVESEAAEGVGVIRFA